jgi:hypothetical protein
MIEPNHPYRGAKAVIATKHNKGILVAPTFSKHLDLSVEEVSVDTDELGTFSGEVERVGTVREVVIKKAELGISVSGNPIGIASEGSIGADPLLPFINSDIELMALVDQERALVIIESLRSTEIIAQTVKISKDSDITNFLTRADFPNHALILRSEDKPVSFCVKGISDMKALDQAILNGLKDFPTLILENDLRAHCSPSRQKNIAALAEKLALRLTHLCPECRAPGWGVIGHRKGLPCQECGEVAEGALAQEILGCGRCEFTELGKSLAQSIDPAQCQLCNP